MAKKNPLNGSNQHQKALAIVIHGNSLLVEVRSHWFTLAHARGRWGPRLALARARQAGEEAARPPTPDPAPGESETIDLVEELTAKREDERAR